MTTKVGEDIHVDPAEVERARTAEIEAERTLRVGDAFHVEHPRLRRDQIVPVKEADYWIVALDGVHFKLVMLSPEKVGIAKVDPKAHDVLLEPAQPVRLPQAPTPVPPADLVTQALAYAQPCTEALDQYRNAVANWEQAVEVHAEPTAEVYLTRFRGAYPGTIPSVVPGKRLANLDGLVDCGREIIQVVHYARIVPGQGAAARRLGIEATRAIEAALDAVKRPPTKRNLRLAGEPEVGTQTVAETALKTLQAEVIDKLLAGIGTCAPTVAGLQDVTPLFLRCGLQALREGYCAAVAIIQAATAERYLRPLRTVAFERDATAAVALVAQQLGQEIVVPEIRWPADLLEPPRLG